MESNNSDLAADMGYDPTNDADPDCHDCDGRGFYMGCDCGSYCTCTGVQVLCECAEGV